MGSINSNNVMNESVSNLNKVIRLSNLLNGINLGCDYRIIEGSVPQILLDETYIISSRLYNNELSLYNKFKDGEKIYSIQLKKYTKDYTKSELEEFCEKLELADKKRIFRISLTYNDGYLYLIDYKISYINGKKVMFPIFGSYNAKIYYESEYVLGVAKNLKSDGYDISII